MRVALALAALSLTAVPTALIAQVQPVMQMQGDAPLLTLAITESIDAKPDTATIGAGVQTIAPTATEALRQNSVKMNALIKAVKARGVADKDIQTTGISLSPQYDYEGRQNGQPPRFVGYQVSNEVRVKTREIAKLGEMLDALVAAGGTNITGPSFSIDADEAIKFEARTRALRRAREQAQFYAQQTGYASVRLVSITESQGYSGGPPMPMQARVMAMDVSEKAPVEPGQVSTAVNLTVQYALVK